MNEKEERKRIRRERIRRRFDNSPRETSQLSPVSESKSEKEKSETQILDSLAFLVKKKKDSLDIVTNFRVDAIKNESDRRLNEEVSREQRCNLPKLDEYGSTEDEIKRIQLSWDSLLQINNPLDLFKGMESITSSYRDYLKGKDLIIDELKKQLIEKDESYLDNLRQQLYVTNQLRFSMDESKLDLQTHYCNELNSIQDALVDDRSLRIQRQLKILNELVEKKAKFLEHCLGDLMKRRKEKQNTVICTQDKSTDVYNDLKSNLYSQVNRLECELAISRAMYQANSDRIEYNLRSTTAKNAESEEKIKKRKKRIVLHKEELSKELDYSRSSEIQDKKKIDILDHDCRRLEGQYNNLLSKLHRFEIVEGQKYSAAAAMYEEEISILFTKISNAKAEVANDFAASFNFDLMSSNEDVTLKMSNELSNSKVMIEEKINNPWVQLESMLFQYHGLLENRERILCNICTLNKQNVDLQQKLDKLLEQDINSSLIVPPLHS